MNSNSNADDLPDSIFSRTSVTVDEAVAILLGWVDGPVRYASLSENPTDEEQEFLDSTIFCLQECADEQLDYLESELDKSIEEKLPSAVIAEKRGAITIFRAERDRAKLYLCAINNELNKGDSSALRIDNALSKSEFKFVTLSSLYQWSQNCDEVPSIGATAPKSKEKKLKPRPKLREQEDVILSKLRELGHEPKRLPVTPSRKRGVKAEVRDALKKSPLFKGSTVFNKAWERLRKGEDIQETP